MSPDLEYWNNVFAEVRQKPQPYQPETHWLTSYIPLMRGQNVQRVLEIGCGSGTDTQFLTEQGFHVTSTDFSTHALSIVRERLPDVSLLLQDTREPFPFGNGSFDLVLGSLSLHYFDRATTARIVRELGRLLRPRGLLLYRVNSVHDPNFQTGQSDLLEQDFLLQDGIRRHYFSIETCRETFQGWEEILLEEKTVDAYGKPKSLCEGLVRKITE